MGESDYKEIKWAVWQKQMNQLETSSFPVGNEVYAGHQEVVHTIKMENLLLYYSFSNDATFPSPKWHIKHG